MINKVLNLLNSLVEEDPSKDIDSHAFTVGREVRLEQLGLDSKSLAVLYKEKYEAKTDEDQ